MPNKKIEGPEQEGPIDEHGYAYGYGNRQKKLSHNSMLYSVYKFCGQPSAMKI